MLKNVPYPSLLYELYWGISHLVATNLLYSICIYYSYIRKPCLYTILIFANHVYILLIFGNHVYILFLYSQTMFIYHSYIRKLCIFIFGNHVYILISYICTPDVHISILYWHTLCIIPSYIQNYVHNTILYSPHCS